MQKEWHTHTAAEVAAFLKVDPTAGISSKEWQHRFATYGPNLLDEVRRAGPLKTLTKQFTDFMVLVLIGAGLISFFLGETVDALAILAIVFINAVLGFVQEYRAERSLAALKELTAPMTTVLRNGSRVQVPATELVPGDVVFLREGDRVPADGRVNAAHAFAVDESALTGESKPVKKVADWIGVKEAELGDRKNMVYMGTSVAKGRADIIVTATGMNTEIGDIASLIQSSAMDQTPLQKRLEQVGRWLVAACIIIVAIVFVTGIARGLPAYQMFLTAVSLAVAAIPEGMPAVVTVALALGVQRMIRRNAIVRRLPAVETLGCASVICSDKTGTLTRNEMTVTRLWLPSGEIKVSGRGYEPKGTFSQDDHVIEASSDANLRKALAVCALCNDATIASEGKKPGGWRVIGDPTEGALRVCASKAGEKFNRELNSIRRMSEIPFDSDRKRMSVVVEFRQRIYSCVKGAPGVILERCTKIQHGDTVRPLTKAERNHLMNVAENYASSALRVLALAYKPLPRGITSLNEDEQMWENDLVFVGLAAMMDPPRQDVAHAIGLARKAGIRTVMVTGDHPKTAAAIAQRIGISSALVTHGRELDAMDDEELERTVETVSVYARVSPRHKLRIVQAFHRLGHVVAMTGDGVNDAPAIKEADIGIAMGIAGTDVTREASSMVLTDDNFASIVHAVEEGRGIYDNIRKFIRYLLACNIGEVMTMFIATLLGWPLPLIPVQILWMNLVTDGLPAMALGVDPPERDVMNEPPRHPREGIFSRGLHMKIAVRGILIALAAVIAFGMGAFSPSVAGDPLSYARTLAFTTLVVAQLIYVFQCRSERKRLMEIGFFGNPLLIVAVGVSFAMQLMVIYWPPASAVFKTVPLAWYDWLIVFSLSTLSHVAETALIGVRRVVRKGIEPIRV